MLTKDDIHAIRHANDICVHLNARHPKGLVRLIKRKPYDAKPFETDQEHELTATAVIENWQHKAGIDDGTIECFAMAGIYHGQQCGVSAILKTLRVGDELEFSFYPDAHSNGYVAKAGLHADVLYLRVYRNGKHIAKWELETSITPANSARMCKGVPTSSDYVRQANEAHQIA